MERRIALGATSEVFAGRDERLDRPVALKVLRRGMPDLRRFRSEARLLANLDHPGLVRVFDAVERDAGAVLVMQLVDGPSLASLLAQGSLGEQEVRSAAAQIAECLAYLHAQGAVHRDVKPANILMGTGDRAYLADFGIARLLDATRLTATGQAIGTLAYMAPEQLSGATVGTGADVYSLGLVLLEALSGERPFNGEGAEEVAARLVRDPDIPPQLGHSWRQLIGAMTARQPAERPSAAVVAARLAPIEPAATVEVVAVPTVVVGRHANGPSPAGAPLRVGRLTKPAQRAVLWGTVVAAAALIVTLVATLGAGKPSSVHQPTRGHPVPTPPTTPAPATTGGAVTSVTTVA
ncbi:MAG TPA: serine/threonine-protein kinase, partial [Acidimicrobiales bacterium]|nr:serine/threonine-protein kinase [Acidimicrobiales bacterium]